ncbi:hypothetical protein B0I35DRAFT_492407 [Stachybotrys elegans]|uniref:Uncharacterized protein n=1 Tax=Stachybotrys elegans TaxID=80388 RepID=A0A8K0SJR9_9HYPO|nr:hypothetical protein B0I35DRAFT_492407 [Stachybotrys elegans]
MGEVISPSTIASSEDPTSYTRGSSTLANMLSEDTTVPTHRYLLEFFSIKSNYAYVKRHLYTTYYPYRFYNPYCFYCFNCFNSFHYHDYLDHFDYDYFNNLNNLDSLNNLNNLNQYYPYSPKIIYLIYLVCLIYIIHFIYIYIYIYPYIHLFYHFESYHNIICNQLRRIDIDIVVFSHFTNYQLNNSVIGFLLSHSSNSHCHGLLFWHGSPWQMLSACRSGWVVETASAIASQPAFEVNASHDSHPRVQTSSKQSPQLMLQSRRYTGNWYSSMQCSNQNRLKWGFWIGRTYHSTN